jgi:hypothetical protein
MNFDVRPFKESEESKRWHWEIIGPLPKTVGASRVKETCCTEPKDDHASACQGFDDKEAAEKDGWRCVKELEAGGVPSKDETVGRI